MKIVEVELSEEEGAMFRTFVKDTLTTCAVLPNIPNEEFKNCFVHDIVIKWVEGLADVIKENRHLAFLYTEIFSLMPTSMLETMEKSSAKEFNVIFENFVNTLDRKELLKNANERLKATQEGK